MLLGILVGFLGTSLGWQINLISIERGLRRGRAAAFLVSCGAIVADITFLYIGFSGAAPLLFHPEWWQIIRWVGIVLLIILAIRTLWEQDQCPSSIEEEVMKRNPTKNFLVGFLVVISNPAIFLLWVGVVGFLLAHFAETRQAGFKERFLVGFVLGGWAWCGPLAFIFLKKLKKWSEKNLHFTSRISAALLLIIALFLIVEKWIIS